MELATAKKDVAIPAVAVLSIAHMLGFAGVLYAIFYASWQVILVAVAYFFICHLSIAFVHRGFTHGAFKMHPVVAFVTAFFFSGVGQGTVLWWTGKHECHHANSDIPGKDPHTTLDGFIHAHMGWLMTKAGISAPASRYMKKNKDQAVLRAMQWQRQYHWLLTFITIVLVPAGIGWILGDVIGGLFVIGFARLVIQWHLTWVVNSVGHTWGERIKGRATNFGNPFGIPIPAILTVGEAYHAHHHFRATDWKLGPRWYHFDLAAWVIMLLIRLGLAKDVKTV